MVTEMRSVLPRPTEEGVGLEPEARLNGDEARATREKIRSIGHGSVIDDYIFEWANKSHLRNHVMHPIWMLTPKTQTS